MLDEESIQKLTRDKCIEKIEGDWSTWFRNFRGNENETWEIQFVPKALSKTKAQSTTKYKFQSSLDPNKVPNISAKWCPDEKFYPAVNGDFFNVRCYFKGALSDPRRFLAIESSLKMMKNDFYFTSKALFVLKTFNFCVDFLVM